MSIPIVNREVSPSNICRNTQQNKKESSENSLKWEERTVGERVARESRRTQPTESTNQGSWGLTETQAVITKPAWI